MKTNMFTKKELMAIPAGRLMNTLIQEYVFDEISSRWSNTHQHTMATHWFEEHPRTCAEDEGGYCSADSVPEFSTDISHAMSIPTKLKGYSLSMKTIGGLNIATFSDVPYGDNNYRWEDYWSHADSMPLAICRAALIRCS